MLFVSSKKLFSFSRYSNVCISDFPSLFPLGHCFRGWSKINFKTYGVISCLNNNLITRFIWYLEKEKGYDIATLSTDIVLEKEHLYGKNNAENMHQKLIGDPVLILVNNPKQQLHASNPFANRIFKKRIIKKVLKSWLYFSFKPHVIGMSLACACMSCVSHSYVLVCHSYVTRMYSYFIRMSLVCTRMSFVCHSYVLVCHSYVIRMSIVCTRMSSLCHSYVVLPWTLCLS